MKEKNLTIPIIVVSIAIPLAVGFLILVPQVKINPGFDTRSRYRRRSWNPAH